MTQIKIKDDRPLRSGIPVLFDCACLFWACSAASYMLAYQHRWLASPVTIFALIGMALAFSLFFISIKRMRVLIAISFAFTGLAIGCYGSYSYYLCNVSCPEGESAIVAVLLTDPMMSGNEWSTTASIETKEGYFCTSKLYLQKDADYLCGEMISFNGKIKPIDIASQDSYSYMSGIECTVNADDAIKLDRGQPLDSILQLRRIAIRVISEHADNQSGILQALICGYRPTIDESGEYEQYKTCGLAHIVAVSGAHLAIVTGILAAVLRFLRVTKSIRFIVLTSFIIFYLVFAGLPISSIRAAIMVVLSMFSGSLGRRSASINALSICILVFIVFDPASCVSISLFLSTASTAGIVIFSELAGEWLSFLPKGIKGAVIEPCAMTISSNLATLPLSASVFNQLPLISILTNIAATPLFSIACVFGLLMTILSCAIPPAAPVLMNVASITAIPLKCTVKAFSSIPYASIAVSIPQIGALFTSVIICFWIYIQWPKPSLKPLLAIPFAVCIFIIFNIWIFLPRQTELVMLDVGQGDSFLLKSERSAVLIDTGNSDSKLREQLAKESVLNLDAIIITHPDDDHCGALDSVFSYVQVNNIVLAKGLLDCSCDKCSNLKSLSIEKVGADNVLGMNAGDRLNAGKFELTCIWPKDYSSEGGNSDSLCLMVTSDEDADGVEEWSMLFVGDVESEQLYQMASAGQLHDIDVFKVGHHGSKASIDENALKVLKPEIALISVGKNNRYGHPSEQTIDLLQKAGVNTLRTDELGTVHLSLDKDEIRIE